MILSLVQIFHSPQLKHILKALILDQKQVLESGLEVRLKTYLYGAIVELIELRTLHLFLAQIHPELTLGAEVLH